MTNDQDAPATEAVTHRAAMAYIRRGLPVFPLKPESKAPDTINGVKDASTDPLAVDLWFREERNIGIAVPAGVVIVDIDVHGEVDGMDAAREWCEQHGDGWFDAPPLCETGGGGFHLWFKHPGVKLRKNPGMRGPDGAVHFFRCPDCGARYVTPVEGKRHWHEVHGHGDDETVIGSFGIDLIWEGRYVVAPPSVTTMPYRWVQEGQRKRTLPERMDMLPDFPAWMIELALVPERTVIEDSFTNWRPASSSGDDLAAAAEAYLPGGIRELLDRHGWKRVRGDGNGDGSRWLRPGSTNQFSATVKYGCLFNYSSAVDLPVTEHGDPSGITLFSLLSRLEHGGDDKATARTLREAGKLPDNSGYRNDGNDIFADHERKHPAQVRMPAEPARESDVEPTTSEVEPHPLQHLYDEMNSDVVLKDMAKREHYVRRSRFIIDALDEYEAAKEAEPFNDGLLVDMHDEDPQWRIAELLPEGGRLLFVAQRKTGKTTIALAVLKAIVEGNEHFLGEKKTEADMSTRLVGGYTVMPLADDERVGFLNYELARATFNGWARQAGIPEERIYLNHLRGMANPFRLQRDLDRQIERFKEHNVKVLVIDPAARAFVGTNLNDTSAAIEWTNAVDYMVEEAGIGECIVTNHAGWDKERGRNSTVFEDWADTIVTIVADEGEDGSLVRYLSAIGRDVEISSRKLDYDGEHRSFVLTGEHRSSGAQGRKEKNEAKNRAKERTRLNAVRRHLEATDNRPLPVGALVEHLRTLGITCPTSDLTPLLKDAIDFVLDGELRADAKQDQRPWKLSMKREHIDARRAAYHDQAEAEKALDDL